MKLCVSGIIFSLLLSAVAKPGESYVLTGREKSVFSIFQTDLKAYPDLYAGEDVNAYYQAFKTLNNLGERKLQLGEELIFPDTKISKKIREAEAAKAAAEADAAARQRAKEEAAAARKQGKETATEATAEPYGQLSLFGSDKRSTVRDLSPEEKQARAEAEQKRVRHLAIHYFQHTLLPHLMYDYNRNIVENIEQGNIDALISQAYEKVDEKFSKALVLHAYPDQKTYVLEFEKPKKGGEYFFFAIKRNESGRARFFSLEQGISFFGTGNESVLYEWLSGREFSHLGGRDYKDLTRFLKELEVGQDVRSENE